MVKSKENKKEKKIKEKESGNLIAVVRVRGSIGVMKEIKDTLNILKLYNKNNCVVVPNTPAYLGMIKKVKDYVTWGEIDDETLNLLKNKRKDDIKKGYFRLNPPRKGYGRKGIKYNFKVGGALGYRKEKINDLIKRML